jgi:hypothetical protein
MNKDLVTPDDLVIASLLLMLSVNSDEVFRFYAFQINLMPFFNSPRGENNAAIPASGLPWHVDRIYLGLIHIKYFANQTRNTVFIVLLFKIQSSFFI